MLLHLLLSLQQRYPYTKCCWISWIFRWDLLLSHWFSLIPWVFFLFLLLNLARSVDWDLELKFACIFDFQFLIEILLGLLNCAWLNYVALVVECLPNVHWFVSTRFWACLSFVLSVLNFSCVFEKLFACPRTSFWKLLIIYKIRRHKLESLIV